MNHIVFKLNGTEHKADIKGAKISVDNGEYRRISQYPHKKEASETKYTVPVGADSIEVYHLIEYNFVHNGINLATGEPYTALKTPAWIWAFIVVYALGFFLIIGGLIGGVLAGLGIGATITVSVSKKIPKTGFKVLICLGILIVIELIGLGTAMLLLR